MRLNYFFLNKKQKIMNSRRRSGEGGEGAFSLSDFGIPDPFLVNLTLQQKSKLIQLGIPVDSITLEIPTNPYYIEDSKGHSEVRDLVTITQYPFTSWRQAIVRRKRMDDFPKFVKTVLTSLKNGEKIKSIQRKKDQLTFNMTGIKFPQIIQMAEKVQANKTRKVEIQKQLQKLRQKMKKLQQQTVVSQDQSRVHQQQLRGLQQLRQRFERQLQQFDEEYQWLNDNLPLSVRRKIQEQERVQKQETQIARAFQQFQAQQDAILNQQDTKRTHGVRLAQQQFLAKILQDQQQAQQAQQDQVVSLARKHGSFPVFDQDQIAQAFQQHMKPYEDMMNTW
jgi:hypothetical protein